MNYVENYVPGKSAANYLSEHYIKAKQSVSNLPNETKTQLLEHTLKPIERVLTLKLGPAGKFVHGQVVKKVGNRIESGKLFKSPGINAGSASQKTELHAFCTQVKTSNKQARDFWNDVKHEDSVKEFMATLFRLAISIYQSMKQERQTTHMKDQFRAVDLNNDGKLDAREIKIYLEYLLNTRLTEMDIDDLFELYDVDKNKVLDFTEFTRMLTRYSTFTGSQCDFSELKNMKVLNAFLEFDQDGDGFISFEEIITFLQKQGLETSYAQSYAIEMFEAADVNSDGLVDFGEFKEIVGDI